MTPSLSPKVLAWAFCLLLSTLALGTLLAQPGSLDVSFDPGEGADWNANTLVIQSGSQILVGGGFEEFNGIERKGIARLNWVGSLDAGFLASLEHIDAEPAEVRSIAIQPGDGKILVGGWFEIANGVRRQSRRHADQ